MNVKEDIVNVTLTVNNINNLQSKTKSALNSFVMNVT